MHSALGSLIYNKTALCTYQCWSGGSEGRGVGAGKGWRFDKGSWPVVETFEFHLFGLEADKDLVTSWLTVALPGRLATKDGGWDMWVFFILMCKMTAEENVTWCLFFSSPFLFK